MASIRDVAKEAGVASCTVSRVLNGTANVAPETEKKIRDAMKKLNYIPNELARGMFRKKANMIAMLVPNIQHPWFASLSSEIERIAYENGYKLILFNTDDKEEREKECLQTLKSNIVDGIMAADLPAVAFLKAALAIGRRIPEDLKIVSYDGTFVTKTCTVELTQIRQPYLEIAKKAANMLFEMINEKMTGSEEEKKYQDVILPVELIKGVTTEQ